MASNVSICGVCEHRHVTKSSVVWCSECEEGLCENCKEHHSFSKASRNHEIVPIDEYKHLRANISQIAQFCNKHNKKYEFFCRKHDCLCCRKCVKDHNGCKDLTDIRNMIHNVKSSTAFQEIEHALSEIAENIKTVRINREENVAALAERRKIVELEIQQFRNKINGHLDKLHDEILKKIKALEEKENNKIQQLLTSIIQREKEISEYKVNIENTKRYASDLQTFLAMKQIEKDIIKEDSYIQSMSKSEQMYYIDISFKKDETLQALTATVKTLGEVVISFTACNVPIQERRNKQAQIIIPPSANYFDHVSLKLKQTIESKLKPVRGCTFLPDGRMVFSSIAYQFVRVLKPDGSADFDLNKIGTVCDVVYIGDNDIAITSGGTGSNPIVIIDVQNRKVKKVLNVNSANHGVTFKDGKLIYCAENKGLRMISLNDESINGITSRRMSFMADVATNGDRLFYTNEVNNNVTCCDFHGNQQWSFRENSVLSYPYGISVDNDGNVYVAGVNSHNVVVFSADGQRHRQLLSSKDGLSFPTAVEYDRLNNKLLVVNNNGNAFLYNVVGH